MMAPILVLLDGPHVGPTSSLHESTSAQSHSQALTFDQLIAFTRQKRDFIPAHAELALKGWHGT